MLEALRRRRRRGVQSEPNSPLAEAYRIMRTNLLVAVNDIERPSIVFTSALAGEGKTSTVANLAPTLAVLGHRVVVVDFDLRNPALHTAFGVPNDRGVADVLRGNASLEDCTQYVGVWGGAGQPDRGLYLVTSGPVPRNPAELVGSRRAAGLIEVLSEQADLVLIDSPPVLTAADTLSLARIASGVVLVVEARKTPVPVVQQAKDALIRNQARLLGVVVSKIQQQDANSFTYGQGADGFPYGAD
jgi:protein-tyrosine kinase